MMNAAKRALLRADILANADPEFVEYRDNKQADLMAGWYNKDYSPSTKAWRDAVPPDESDEAMPWAQFDGITGAKREAFLARFFVMPRNYARGTVRKWITDVWGNASAGSNAEGILKGAGLRDITRAEAVLGGSATAATNAVSAIKLDWTGPLADDDIRAALG